MAFIGAVLSCAIPGLIESANAECGYSWGGPSNHFEGVNSEGDVSLWRKFGKVVVGKSEFPLLGNFRSSRQSSSGILGAGWVVPLLESHVVQQSDGMFSVLQPDGYTRWFWRSKENPSLLIGQGGWAAELSGDTFKAVSPCGSSATYERGRIKKLAPGQGAELIYHYENGQLRSLLGGTTECLRITPAETPESPRFLDAGFNRIRINVGQRPIVRPVNGSRLVVTTVHSLASIENGMLNETYTYGVGKNLNATIQVDNGSTDRNIEWNPDNGRILSDGNFAYTVEKFKRDGFRILRTSASGGSEYYSKDGRGTETVKRQDGTEIVWKAFASGKLVGRPRFYEIRRPGAEPETRTFGYDETGQMIARTDEWGRRLVLVPENGTKSWKISGEKVTDKLSVELLKLQNAVANAPENQRAKAAYDLCLLFLNGFGDFETAEKIAVDLPSGGWRDAALMRLFYLDKRITPEQRAEKLLALNVKDPIRQALVVSFVETLKGK